MFKTELKNFDIICGGEQYSAAVPTSLFSVLSESGVITNPYYADEEEKRLTPLKSECEVRASFNLTSEAAKLKFAYLRIPVLDAEAEVIFNGKPIFRLTGSRKHNLDISGLVVTGENTLVIKLESSDTPRDVTLFEGVNFFAFSRAQIASIYAKPAFISDSVSVDVAVEMLGDKEDVKAVATLISPTGRIYYGGVTNGSTVINIADPLLWWPAGYGIQNLYKLTVSLYYENEAIDSKEVKLGLRSVFNDSREGAAFTVNGTEFFAMGAEYVMGGATPALSHFLRSPTVVPAVARANMNFIRFSGKGRYPCEDFLDLCDSYGITIEYILGGDRLRFADPASLRRELIYNFTRLSKHPSVICITYNKSDLSEERQALINEAKGAVLSSAFIRAVMENDSFESVVSIPEKKTLASICEDEDLNIFSYVMDRHADSPEAVAKMLSRASESYKYAYSMDELIHISGVLGAHENEAYADECREARGRVGAAVVYSLNDVKPAVSHAMIDFDGRYKVSYYMAKQFFSPVRILLKKTGKYAISFVLSNETKRSFSGVVEYTVKTSTNEPVFSSFVSLSVEKYSALASSEIDLSEYIEGHERDFYLEYVLKEDTRFVSLGTHLFVPPKHFRFVNPVILSEISGSGREFTIACKASAFAKDVTLRFENIEAVFDDNCFDLTDSTLKKRINFVTASATSAERLMAELRVMSIYNIGRDD